MSKTGFTQKIKLAKRNLEILPRVAWKELNRKLLLSYRLNNDGKSFWPQQVVWEITMRCNLSCIFCPINKLRKENYWEEDIKEEMSTEECKDFVDQVASFKPFFHITGAETFMREDMIEIIEYIKQKNMICTIVTNGAWEPEKADEIAKSGLDVIHFSLDGPAEIHNEIRGKEIFEKVTSNIRRLIEKREDLPVIKLNCTISNYNYERLEEMVDIAEDLGVDTLQFQHLWFTDEAHAETHKRQLKQFFGMDSKGIDSFVTDIEMDLEKLKETVKKLKKRNTEVDIGFNPEIPPENIENYYGDLDWTTRDKCVFPWYQTDIKPNGDVSACMMEQTSRYVFGNLKEEKFGDIWNNEKARKFRKRLKKSNMFSGCTRCCGLFTT